METNMSIIRTTALTLLLSLSICFSAVAQSINLACQHNQFKDKGARPIDFKKNKQGLWEMSWDGENVNRDTVGNSPSKRTLVSLEISDSKISYKFDYVAYATQNYGEWGQTRIGTISRIDGIWTEYVIGYGEIMSGIPQQKFTNLDGKCELRGTNKF
ncbi:hypothetical protein [Polynucleobacter sp. AP-Sving-400A-A2]|uniref:hypothetical protein n=1 Tax=Polynucleobacter sp. AP-Sving-400A-A2 TaxID=2081049 RepID=UPI001BFCDC21|nr:hypothetical protein [Polynucleobacter sp. AP-Sving-400A-A2]QWE15355.1 hypothetical protein C2758_04310 [Polynucleobacter sp. AP-Sving-400A-A2]